MEGEERFTHIKRPATSFVQDGMDVELREGYGGPLQATVVNQPVSGGQDGDVVMAGSGSGSSFKGFFQTTPGSGRVHIEL